MTYFKKLFFIIGSKNKIYFLLIVFGMTIGGILETIGLGLIIPFLDILLNNNTNTGSNYANQFQFIYFNISKSIASLSFLIISVYLFKSIFLILLQKIQLTFTNKIRINLTKLLYKAFMENNNNLNDKINSNHQLEKIVTEIPYFADTHLNSLLLIIVELQMIIFILIFLFFIQPTVTLIAILLSMIFLLTFHLFSKSRLNKWGTSRVNIEKNIFKNLKETFQGANEIKLNNKINFFLNDIISDYIKFSKLDINFKTFLVVPKNLLELLAIIILIITITTGLSFGYTKIEIFQIASLFAIAAFKMIPAISLLAANIQNFLFTKPSSEVLLKEIIILNYNESFDSKKIYTLKKSLEIKNLYFNYHNCDYTLKNINAEFCSNKITAITGDSGSGKTTLINLIMGLYKPTSGEISADGINILYNDKSWFENIGYVSQDMHLLDNNILANIVYGENPEKISMSKVELVSDLSGLKEFIEISKNGYETNVGEMGNLISGGQKQRICLARALYKNSELLIFDEATNALDKNIEIKIFDSLLKIKKYKTVIVITHNLDLLRYCDTVYKFSKKSLIKLK